MSKKKTSRDEQAERTRAHILETALRLFSERGISGTSTRRIAQEAGVSEGLIFHHFPKKRDLITGIKGRNKSRLAIHIEQMMSDPEGVPVTEAVRVVSSGFLHILGAENAEARLFRVLLGESLTDPELGALFREVSGGLIRTLALYLESRVDAGELRRELNCEAAAMNLIGSFIWYFVSTGQDSEEGWLEAGTAYADQVVELWLHGALEAS